MAGGIDIPEWARTRDIITVDDVVRAGACADGAVEWRDRNFPEATAVPVDKLLAVAEDDEREYILIAAGRVDGDGNGDGCGYGNGNGYGYGYGDGYGYGYGSGYGYGYGYGYGKQGESMKHADYISLGSPVAIRSYVSGVFVGLLHGGEGGTVVLTNWRWLRRWEGVGNDGSVYDLVASDVTPQQRGPFTETPVILQQADVMVISDEAYERLVGETVQ